LSLQPRPGGAWWAIVVYLALSGAAATTKTPIDDLIVMSLLPMVGMVKGPSRPEDLIRAMPESVYRVLQPIPALGALPGDFIVVHPHDPDVPCALQRPLELAIVLQYIGGIEAPLVYAAPPTPPRAGPDTSAPEGDSQAAAGGLPRSPAGPLLNPAHVAGDEVGQHLGLLERQLPIDLTPPDCAAIDPA
jgi:hypothetical protein